MGYGIRYDRWEQKNILAHRFYYVSLVGPLKGGELVCHKCNNPGCVNPDHLYAGTQKDNMQDLYKRLHKQRHAERMREIRQSY
jgi:hypothetical protein